MLRRFPLSLLACFCFCWSGLANAAPDASKVESSRRDSSGPSGDRSAGTSGNAEIAGVNDADSLEQRLGTREGQRSWSIAASMETHVAFVQTEPDDLRTAPGKLYNYYQLSPQVFVDQYDQIRVDGGLYQYFTADEGESGLRFADIAARYTRYIPIATGSNTEKRPSSPPSRGALLRLELSATAPTSFLSQEHGIITVPRVRLYIERTFLNDSLLLAVNGFAEYYIDRFRTAQGGDDNAISRYSAQVTADYVIPFEKRLSIGALVASSWIYYYEPDVVNLPYPGGVSSMPHQPPQQGYSAEVDALFAFPTWKGIRASAGLTYSLGDNTVLHDGVQHLYFAFYRRSSEMYATLTARY